MGIETGVDLAKVRAASRFIAGVVDHALDEQSLSGDGSGRRARGRGLGEGLSLTPRDRNDEARRRVRSLYALILLSTKPRRDSRGRTSPSVGVAPRPFG